jgi:hypothetical protein
VSIESAIRHFRGRQQAQFTETVTISRPTLGAVLDPDTGEFTPAPVVIYEGAAKVRPEARAGLDATVGHELVRLVTLVGKLPPDSPARKNDLWEITGSRWDPGMVGRVFRVDDAPPDGWQIARVCRLEEVT